VNFAAAVIECGMCEYCYVKMEEYDDYYSCTGCRSIIEKTPMDHAISETTPTRGYSRNQYKSESNFVNSLDSYEGLGPKVITSKLIATVDDYLLKRMKKKETLTPLDTREIFKVTGNSAFFSAVHLFLHVYIGKPLPNIKSIRTAVIADYKTFDHVYLILKDPSRHSSLNSQLMMYVLLTKHGHKCSPDDFKIPGTETIAIEQKQYVVRVFKKLKWDYRRFV
jgi:hypothetical protein